MNGEEFLDELLLKFNIDDILNNGFGDVHPYSIGLLEVIDQKKIWCISSECFHENIAAFAALKNRNCLKSIISLPIFNNDDNLLILIFDPLKTDSSCLFIDESDSLIHRHDSADWSYAGAELIDRIVGNYNRFEESETSVILNLEDMFFDVSIKEDDELLALKTPSDDTSTKKHRKVSDELLALKTPSSEVSATKHRVIHDEVADGLLELKQKQSVRDEISKHDVKSSQSQQSSGFTFLNDAMYYKKRQNPENLLYKDNKPLIDGEVQFRKLRKIADLHNIYSKNSNDSILIATCKTCKSKLVFHNRDISDFEGEVFIEIINVDEAVSMDYLYEYLSSDNGLSEILYFSKGSNFITPDDIKNIKIPIPPLEIQKEIVKVARESREFFKSVDLLKKQYSSNILDYKHMRSSLGELKADIAFDGQTNEVTSLSRSWRHAYKGLIWPLAISYLSATKGGFEIVEKKDNYLVLFEFIAAFNAIVLLSGLPDDVYRDNFSKIWNANLSEYKRMTFANWVYLSKNLADVYNSNNFSSQIDGELFDVIGGDKILDILEHAKNLRNDEHHGPQTNSYEAKEIIEKLDAYLDDIFDILEVYSNYKLIYVTGDIQSANQAYSHRVILLNGPCAQPIYDSIKFDTLLQKDSLYLYNPKNNKKLLLEDNFVKFMPIDENRKRWALFIYYSCDKKEFNAFYKCFQSKEKDVRVGISSLKRDILFKQQ